MRSLTARVLVAQAAILFTTIAIANASSFTSTSTMTLTTTKYVAFRTTTETPSTTTRETHSSPSAIPANGPYHNLQSAILNSTNYFRAQHLADPLSWDSNLADYAQTYAQNCIWEHSGGPYGENLAENFATPTLAVDAWADEEKKYRYPNEGFSEATGHYTQLVWQNTTHVGCGAVHCNNAAANGAKGWFLVCEYSPPGNVDGGYRFNVQKPGESADGKLGFGVMSSGSSSSTGRYSLCTLLTIVSVLAAMFP